MRRARFFTELEAMLAEIADQREHSADSGSASDTTARIDLASVDLNDLCARAEQSQSNFYASFAGGEHLAAHPDEAMSILLAEAVEYSFMPYFSATVDWLCDLEGDIQADPLSANIERSSGLAVYALLRVLAAWMLDRQPLNLVYSASPPMLAADLGGHVARFVSRISGAPVDPGAATRVLDGTFAMGLQAARKLGPRGLAQYQRLGALAAFGIGTRERPVDIVAATAGAALDRAFAEPGGRYDDPGARAMRWFVESWTAHR